jgi:replicative DNA helicase
VTRDEAKEYIKNNYRFYFEQLLSKYEKGKKSYPLCPKCNEHELQTDPKKEGYYRCFKCGEYGDVFDYIGLEYSLSNFNDKFNKAIELYGTVDKESRIEEIKDLHIKSKQDTDIKNKEKATYTKYYEEISKNIAPINYLLNRGISLEAQKEFGIRFDPKWVHPNGNSKNPQPMVIIPTGTDNTSYLARSISCNFKCKVGNVNLFNSNALKSDKDNPDPVFITEGEIDALSILECRFKAVGLSSTTNKNQLTSKLKNMLSKEQYIPQLILYLDNDTTGKEATQTLEKELKEFKIPCVNFYELIKEHKEEYKDDEESEYLETLLKVKDPNDALKKNKNKFEQALLYAYTTSKFEPNKLHEEIFEDAKTEKIKPQEEKKHTLLKYLESLANKSILSTGFDNLDELLNGGFKGGWLYTIGAIPSLGKTTLAMQMADHIAAETKRCVYIFSLEMSENDLMLKSIIRENYIKYKDTNETVKSVAQIYKTCFDKKLNELTDNKYFNWGLNHYYSEINPYIRIDECSGDIGVNSIKEKIETFIKDKNELSIIIIDYVQILAPYKRDDLNATKSNSTDKQNLDKNIMELKRITRDKDIPIIVISSFNRDNYASEVSFKGFKESGAIEYSSDVIIGLQLKIDRTPPTDNKKLSEEEALKRINDAKNKTPREVELVILKNRFGKPYEKIPFNYYPQYDFFEELTPKQEKISNSTKTAYKEHKRRELSKNWT